MRISIITLIILIYNIMINSLFAQERKEEAEKEVEIEEITIQQNLKKNSLTELSSNGGILLRKEQLLLTPSFMGEVDILKGLQLLPGISASSEGSSQLSVRGGTSDQTLVLYNNVPVFNPNHSFGFVSIFNPNVVTNAEIFKNVFPAQYGERLSGVTNISGLKDSYNSHLQSINIGTLSMGAHIEGPLSKNKNAYYSLSGRRSTTDLLLKAAYSIYDIDGTLPLFSFGDINFETGWNIKRTHYFRVFGYYTNDYLGISSETNMITKSKASNSFRWSNKLAGLNWIWKNENSIKGEVTVYYSGLDNSKVDKTGLDDSYRRSETESRIYEAGLKSMFFNQIGKHKIEYGILLFHRSFKPEIISYTAPDIPHTHLSKSAPDQTSGILTSNMQIRSNKWVFKPSLRIGGLYTDKKLIPVAEPRLLIQYYWNNTNRIEAGFNRASQPVFLLNPNAMTSPLQFWYPVTDRRQPGSYQWNLSWKNQSIRKWLFTAETYYKYLQNQYFINNQDDFFAYNGGLKRLNGFAYGIETSAQYSDPVFQASISYTYARSYLKNDKERVLSYHDIPHELQLWGNWVAISSKKRKHNLSVSVNYRSGAPVSLPNEIYPSVPGFDLDYSGSLENTPIFPNYRIRAYFRMDLNYSMERFTKRGSYCWQISLLNATNTPNPFMVYRERNAYKSMVLIPILPSISYRLNFKAK